MLFRKSKYRRYEACHVSEDMPVAIPAGVTVEIAENNKVTVKGPKGTLVRVLPAEMEIKIEGGEVIVTRPNDLKKMKSLTWS